MVVVTVPARIEPEEKDLAYTPLMDERRVCNIWDFSEGNGDGIRQTRLDMCNRALKVLTSFYREGVILKSIGRLSREGDSTGEGGSNGEGDSSEE